MQGTKIGGRVGATLRSFGVTTALAWQGLRTWETKRFAIAGVAAAAVLSMIGMATVLIPNPIFSRDIAPVWWNYPVWVSTSALAGMLIASYVRGRNFQGSPEAPQEEQRRPGRFGIAGGVLAWFAVGCPVCNKIALLALGYTGAIAWFAPIQPFLAIAALLLTAGALLARLRGSVSCRTRQMDAEVAE